MLSFTGFYSHLLQSLMYVEVELPYLFFFGSPSHSASALMFGSTDKQLC